MKQCICDSRVEEIIAKWVRSLINENLEFSEITLKKIDYWRYANDIVLFLQNPEKLQGMLNEFFRESKGIGLEINK